MPCSEETLGGHTPQDAPSEQSSLQRQGLVWSAIFTTPGITERVESNRYILSSSIRYYQITSLFQDDRDLFPMTDNFWQAPASHRIHLLIFEKEMMPSSCHMRSIQGDRKTKVADLTIPRAILSVRFRWNPNLVWSKPQLFCLLNPHSGCPVKSFFWG